MEQILEDKRLITQAEYARLKKVSRARVSQMIKEKKVICVWIRGAKLIMLKDSDIEK